MKNLLLAFLTVFVLVASDVDKGKTYATFTNYIAAKVRMIKLRGTINGTVTMYKVINTNDSELAQILVMKEEKDDTSWILY